MLLGTIDASLLGNMLADIEINRAGDGMIRAGYESKIKKINSTPSFNLFWNTKVLSEQI